MTRVLRYFDTDAVPDSSVVFILGRRGSGKSTLAANLLATKRKTFNNGGICVSPTESVNPFWSKHIPKKYVFDKWNPRMVTKLLEGQKQIRLAGEEPKPVFAIFDDLMFSSNFSHSTELKQLVLNGRHSNVFVVVLAQYIFDIPPAIRSNVDFVFVLQDNVIVNRKNIYEHFGGIFASFDDFDKIMKKSTSDSDAMVLDQTKSSYEWDQVVSYYSPRPGVTFKIGKKEEWKDKSDSWWNENDSKGIRVKKIYIKPTQSD